MKSLTSVVYFRNSLIAHWLSEIFLEDIVVLMGEVHIGANIYIFLKWMTMTIFICVELEFLEEIVIFFCLFQNSLIIHWLSGFIDRNTALLMREVNLGAIIYFFVEVDDNADFCLA